jgi:phosphohistidine phosphatase
MKLYFLRHGAAEDVSPSGKDWDRRLTETGIEEMAGVARGLAELIGEVDVVLTSPLTRAHETAKIAAAALQVTRGPIQVSEKLASGSFGLEELEDLVQEFSGSYRVLMVGHEPDFSGVVGRLTGARIEFKKAGLAFVETAYSGSHGGVLRWLLTPRHLVLAGRRP